MQAQADQVRFIRFSELSPFCTLHKLIGFVVITGFQLLEGTLLDTVHIK